jgi:hypothetical protein
MVGEQYHVDRLALLVTSTAGPVSLVSPANLPGGERVGSVSRRTPPYSRIAVGPPTSWIDRSRVRSVV